MSPVADIAAHYARPGCTTRPVEVNAPTGTADVEGMHGELIGSKTRKTALAAYRGRHFQGFAVRTGPDGWVCVITTGMSWSKMNCRTVEDARCHFRAITHASRFDVFDDLEALCAVVRALPPYEQPGILPWELPGIPQKLPKLAAR